MQYKPRPLLFAVRPLRRAKLISSAFHVPDDHGHLPGTRPIGGPISLKGCVSTDSSMCGSFWDHFVSHILGLNPSPTLVFQDMLASAIGTKTPRMLDRCRHPVFA